MISTRITIFTGCQPSSVVLCIQNSALRTKIACLYETQPSCVFFGWKTAPFGLELQGSVCQKPHLLFLHAKFDFWTRITSLYGSQTLPVVLCMENSNFTTRLTILNGSQTSSAVLSTHNSVLNRRTKNIYWFQTSPVVLYLQNSDFRTRITSFCGSKTQPVDFECKTATSGPE